MSPVSSTGLSKDLRLFTYDMSNEPSLARHPTNRIAFTRHRNSLSP